eukprot:2399008-Karenia_brevis.AAC.1
MSSRKKRIVVELESDPFQLPVLSLVALWHTSKEDEQGWSLNSILFMVRHEYAFWVNNGH